VCVCVCVCSFPITKVKGKVGILSELPSAMLCMTVVHNGMHKNVRS